MPVGMAVDPFNEDGTAAKPSGGEVEATTGKASHILGLNPLNAHLLAPAGLPTGEAAYDRVGLIAGASMKLDSDDEDDGEDESHSGGRSGRAVSEEASATSSRKRATAAAADGGKRVVKKFFRAIGA